MNMNIHHVKEILLKEDKQNHIMMLRIITNNSNREDITLFMDKNVKQEIKTVKEF